MEHVENFQPTKAKQALKSAQKNKPSNQKWARIIHLIDSTCYDTREFDAYSSTSDHGKSTGYISFSS